MRIAAPAVAVAWGFALAACASPASARKPGLGLTDAADQRFQPLDPAHPGGPEVAVVRGDLRGPTGLLFRTPPGFDAGVHTWFQPAKAAHYDRCAGPEACLLMLVFPRGPVRGRRALWCAAAARATAPSRR